MKLNYLLYFTEYSSIQEQLVAFELENQRLQQELLEIQDRNNKLLARKANGYSDGQLVTCTGPVKVFCSSFDAYFTN